MLNIFAVKDVFVMNEEKITFENSKNQKLVGILFNLPLFSGKNRKFYK